MLGLGTDRSLAVPFDALVQSHAVTVHESVSLSVSEWEPRTGPFAVGVGHVPQGENFEIWVHGGMTNSDWRIVELRTSWMTPTSTAAIPR